MSKKTKVAIRIRIDRDVTHFVRQWRKHREMSIVQLGEAAEVSASMISQLETGKANYTQVTLESIAKALRVHPALLLAFDPNVPLMHWSDLLKGWCEVEELDKGVFNVVMTNSVEAAFRSASQLKRGKANMAGWAST
jgi:DNA-binding Xre family transcriptional regulator